jgi:hypothetical protein
LERVQFNIAVEDVGVLDRQPTKGVPEVDECGLTKIGNSKEETRSTQFRQVRAARCVIPYVLYAAYPRERGLCLALYSPGGRVTSRFEERVLVGYV